jgi:hypothetical protein
MSILTTRHRALSGWHRPRVANAALMFGLALVSAANRLAPSSEHR